MSKPPLWPPRSTRRARTLLAPLTALTLAGLLLASCATSAAPGAAPVVGVPSIGISVPLGRVACTLADACVALGASNAGAGPSTTAEYRTVTGRWLGLATPSSPAPQFVASACSQADCLIGGAQAGDDLLWDFHGPDHTLTTLATPTGGVDVGALDCVGPATCVTLDYDAHGAVRLSLTLDGGVTWSTPLVLPWAQGDTIAALACHSTNDCLVGVNTPTGTAALEATHDAGVTWTGLDAASSWSSLDALTCRERSCVALVERQGGQRLLHSTTFGRTWRGVDVAARAAALACTSLRHCVLVGQSTTGAPWLAQVTGDVVSARALKYVAAPLVDVACGTTTCAAVAATTVLAFAP